MSEPADASMMNVVSMSPRRSSRPDDEFAELFAATYPQVVRTVWFVTHDRAVAEASRRSRRKVLEQAAGTGPLIQDGLRLPDPELIAAIRTLPAKQRAVVVLFYLEDRPMEEVAGLVGCSTSTGFVHLHNARKRLAATLGEEVDSNVD